MTITKDLTISQVLEMKPEAAQVLTKNGMHCLGCFIASGETVEQAAEAHGINIDTLMEELNAVASA
jgi:hybrid cluster-associated redox disulfide protein